MMVVMMVIMMAIMIIMIVTIIVRITTNDNDGGYGFIDCWVAGVK